MDKHYFEKTVGKTHTVYGPFATLQEARKVAFFHRDANSLHRAQKNNGSGRVAFSTCQYNEYELASFASDPAAYNYAKVVVKAVAPMHRSWRAFPADFRASYFADSYKHVFGEAFHIEGST